MVSCKVLTVVCVVAILLSLAFEAEAKRKQCGKYYYHHACFRCYCMRPKKCKGSYYKCLDWRTKCYTLYGNRYRYRWCCYKKRDRC